MNPTPHSSNRKTLARLNQISLTQWLIIAAAFHLTFTLSIFLIGHFRIFPNHFDQNGIGISFAVDSVVYRGLIAAMAEALHQQGFGVWYGIQAPLHCRIYSLSFLFPGRIVGYNILAAEPFNLFYYLSLLVVVYSLGKEMFDVKVGFRSAVIIALWPSFLLHSTQLIRDPVSVLCMLGVMLILVVLLVRRLTWQHSGWIGISTVGLLIVFWAARGNVWTLVVAALVITVVLFTFRILREKSLLLPNLVLLLVIFAAVLVIPTQIQSTTIAHTKSPTSVIALPIGSNQSSHNMLWRLGYQIRSRRLGFLVYEAQGSNIDADITFNSAGEIIRYLPRAAVVGFFAPFPRMWFDAGVSGRSGRLLAASETLAMYMLYLPMLMCVWRERKRLSVWLIIVSSSVSLIALGLVVPNAGALYRLRYVFWMMMIVLAMKGISDLRVRSAGHAPNLRS